MSSYNTYRVSENISNCEISIYPCRVAIFNYKANIIFPQNHWIINENIPIEVEREIFNICGNQLVFTENRRASFFTKG